MQSEKFLNTTKNIFIIALPVILQNLVQYLLVFTDTLFVGRYSLEGLAAINNVLAPYFMFFSFFLALSNGVTIVISQKMGGNKLSQATRVAEVSLLCNQLISLLYFLLWFTLGRQILTLVGARGEILNLASEYVKILSFIYLFIGIGLTIGSIFQGIGNTVPTMIASIIKTILNIFLNWILIFGKFGFPEFGIAGAALGTVISEAVSVLILIILINKEKIFRIRLRGILKPAFNIYRLVVKFGLPMGIEFILWSLGNSALIFMLNQIDNMSAGYYGLLFTFIRFSVYVYSGFSVANMIMVGKATGANDPEEAFRICNINILFSLIVCAAASTLFLVWPKQIIGVFTENREVVNYLAGFNIITILIMFPKALNIVVGGAIRGHGDTKWMLLTQLIGTIVHILLSILLVFVLKFGFVGILISILIDEAWRGIVNYLRFYTESSKKRKLSIAGQN